MARGSLMRASLAGGGPAGNGDRRYAGREMPKLQFLALMRLRSAPHLRAVARDRREIGGATAVGYFRARSLTEGGYVAWVLRLVEIGAEGEGSCADVVEISRPDGLVDIADLGLTLAEAKLVLAGVQREIVAAPARDHPVPVPGSR